MQIEALKNAVEKRAEVLGVTEYEVFYKSEGDTTVETLNREISTFSSSNVGGVSVRVLHGGKMGYASSEMISEKTLADLVDIAVENAKYTDREDTVGIYSGSPSYDKNTKPTHVTKSVKELTATALSVANGAYSASELIKDGTATAAGSGSFSIFMFNSKGLTLKNEGGFDYAYCEAVIESQGEFQSGFSIKELKGDECGNSIAEECVAEATSKLGAGLVKTGKYDVIFSGKQMRQLLSAFAPAFSAKNAQMGMSLLADKEGKVVASPLITLTDDPMRRELSVGTTFDAEGVCAVRKTVIDRGILRTLLHNRETAKRQGIESTGNAARHGYSSPIGIAPYAFCIEKGTATESEMMTLADGGILVTELKGLHAGANAITGDFSLECAGYTIKDGARQRAIKSFTVSGNFFELLKNVSAVSDKIEFGLPGVFTTYGSPAILVKDMTVAGE